MAVSWRGFYAIVDPDVCAAGPLEVADALLRGGCAVLQLRYKGRDDRACLELARALVPRCRAAGVPFVMNDRFDLALLAEADGLHLGQEDLPIEEARRFFRGPIGVSTHDLGQLRTALAAGADLVGFGPVFATTTKANPDPVVGLEGLREACTLANVPVVAIGGLDVARARACREVGASLVAAIGATCGAKDPEAAARAFHTEGGAS
ncbi:MAG: thiamine phosphate synthase [Sandaracinus sp.]|nr:thiamine phosphate synthase [Sandaracinus sp.]